MGKLLVALILAVVPMFVSAKIVAKAVAPDKTLLMYDDKCAGDLFQKFTVVGNDNKELFHGCWFAHGESVVFLESSGQIIVLDYSVIQVAKEV